MSKKRRRSGTPWRSIAIRSTPIPKAKPWTTLGVVSVVGDEPEDVGVDHPGPADLDPADPLAEPAALAAGEGAGAVAGEAGDVELDARLGEGEEVRPHPRLAPLAEDRPQHLFQGPLEVGERDPLADREALDLMEHRAVGGVGVAAVDLARHDQEDRRRLGLHRPGLDRRGVGPQQDLGVRLDVEGVLEHPRRVPGRVVERGEVVVVVLDLGALQDPVSEADHHVLDLAGRAGDQVQVPGRGRGRPGQGDVDPILGEAALELGRVEVGGAGLEQRLERLAGAVGAASDRPPLLLGEARDPAQDRGQLGFAAEVADPQLLELGGAPRGLDRGGGLGSYLLDTVKHLRWPPAWRATISGGRRWPPRRRR